MSNDHDPKKSALDNQFGIDRPFTNPKKFDIVEKAEHYNQGGVECIDALRAAGVSNEPGFQAWLRLTCIKYLWRLPHKAKPIEDAKKTRYYLAKLIEEIEKGDTGACTSASSPVNHANWCTAHNKEWGTCG